ncbi:MAG: Hsp20/alpha crystallin family protein [Planctomycetales bacterium]|nr:Hsp20/alpha crystallin family protein [Planctomycetales bacterium]
MSRTVAKNRLREMLPAHWSDLDSFVEQWFGNPPNAPKMGYFAPASLWEDQDAFYVEVDAPGVNHDAFEITFEKGALLISAERAAPPEERKGLVDERRYGKFSRTVTLPETVDPESIEAHLTDGVLGVRIAKKPEAQPRRIEIKVS